jgi:hypothetical protein
MINILAPLKRPSGARGRKPSARSKLLWDANYFIVKNRIEILLVIFALAFGSWLMFHTFSHDNGHILIAGKAWSDFASHIPLIRSFSLGNNFPPEYPLFPGEPIRYHFLFYALVGLLERAGIRIDYALNIPSALSFAALIIAIYFFAKFIFKSRTIGVLSAVFFLFNGSFSFLEFFKTHPPSLNTINDIILNSTFSSFGPYDGKIVSAFWNLNIYTNQRHLALAFTFSIVTLFIFLFIIPKMAGRRKILVSISFGIMLGLFFYFHLAVLLMTVVAILLLAIFTRRLKEGLLVLSPFGIVVLPQYLYLTSEGSGYSALFNPGYLIANTLTFYSFINYWILNLGLHVIFIPLGLFFAKKQLRLFFFAIFSAFILGNLFQFSPDIAGNHKFFNFFMLFGVMFTAFAIHKLWKKIFLRPILGVSIFLLILSGIIDFFPVYNDKKISIADSNKNSAIAWIIDNTSPDALFLNSSYLYTPASLAGRKIFLGWPYFSWSQGYDTLTRDNLRKKLFNPESINYFCKEAIRYNIDYVSIENITPDIDFVLNQDFFDRNFKKVYENKTSEKAIYKVAPSCKN